MELYEFTEINSDEIIKVVVKYRRPDNLTETQIEAMKRACGDLAQRFRRIVNPETKTTPARNRRPETIENKEDSQNG
jgi:hypothetical protein